MFKNNSKCGRAGNRQKNSRNVTKSSTLKNTNRLDKPSYRLLPQERGQLPVNKKTSSKLPVTTNFLNQGVQSDNNINKNLKFLHPIENSLLADNKDQRILRRSKRLIKSIKTSPNKNTNLNGGSRYYLDLIKKQEEKGIAGRSATSTQRNGEEINNSKSVLKQIDNFFNIKQALQESHSDLTPVLRAQLREDRISLSSNDNVSGITPVNKDFNESLLESVNVKVSNLKYKHIDKVKLRLKQINGCLNGRNINYKNMDQNFEDADDTCESDGAPDKFIPQSMWIYRTPERQRIKHTPIVNNDRDVEPCILQTNGSTKYLFKVKSDIAKKYDLELFSKNKVNIPVDDRIVTPLCKVSTSMTQDLWDDRETLTKNDRLWSNYRENDKENNPCHDGLTFVSPTMTAGVGSSWNVGGIDPMPFSFKTAENSTAMQGNEHEMLPLIQTRPCKNLKNVERQFARSSRHLDFTETFPTVDFVDGFPKRPKLYLNNPQPYNEVDMTDGDIVPLDNRCVNSSNLMPMTYNHLPATITSQNAASSSNMNFHFCVNDNSNNCCFVNPFNTWCSNNQNPFDQSQFCSNHQFTPEPTLSDEISAIKYYSQRY